MKLGERSEDMALEWVSKILIIILVFDRFLKA